MPAPSVVVGASDAVGEGLRFAARRERLERAVIRVVLGRIGGAAYGKAVGTRDDDDGEIVTVVRLYVTGAAAGAVVVARRRPLVGPLVFAACAAERIAEPHGWAP